MSKATALARARASSVAPPLTMMPERAAALMPPMKATGAAMSSGHGVASTRTAAKRTGSPERYQASPATISETTVKGTA